MIPILINFAWLLLGLCIGFPLGCLWEKSWRNDGNLPR